MKRTKPRPADIAQFDHLDIHALQFFIATARLALKRRLKRDNQPKAGPEARRGPGKPGGGKVPDVVRDGMLAGGGESVA